MANTLLDPGYNIVINHKVGDKETPIYPLTRTENVKDKSGNTLDDIIKTLATKAEARYVPTPEASPSSLRFLRNDNTWAEVQSATKAQKGIVKLSDDTNSDLSTVAATSNAVKVVKDAVDSVSNLLGSASDASTTNGDTAFDKINTLKTSVETLTTNSANYVLKSQLSTASTDSVTGIATLDKTGKVPAAQLPSFVDDVLEYSALSSFPKTGETGKIYVATDTNITYRWSGSTYVVISDTIALGETSSTAYRGDLGKVAYTHSQSTHARTDATKTEASDTNGYIKINDTNTLVYIHPGSGTNPHGTTAKDIGLENVENKSSETIRGELTKANVTKALAYTPQNAATVATASTNGVMSSTQAAKLNNCMEISFSESTPTFTNGIWFKIISQD